MRKDLTKFGTMRTSLRGVKDSSKSIAKKMRENWSAITIWNGAKPILSAAAESVPGMSVVVELVDGIVGACEKAKSNKESLAQLSERCQVIRDTLKGYANRANERPPQLDEAVFKVKEVFLKIKVRLDDRNDYTQFESVLFHAQIRKEIEKCHEEISACIQDYGFLLILQIREWQETFQQNVERDKIWIADQFSDVKQGQKMIVEIHQANFRDLTIAMQKGFARVHDNNKKRAGIERNLFLTLKMSGQLLPNHNLDHGEVTISVGEEVKFGRTRPDTTWHKGTYLGSQAVLVKTIRKPMLDDHKVIERFEREAKVWVDVWNDDNGRYTVPTYGFWETPHGDTGELHLVYPYYRKGTADSYLRAHPEHDHIAILLDVAKGLAVLHGMKIMHGDVRGNNIVIGKNNNGLLSDFGLSKALDDVDDSPHMSTPDHDSQPWWAPEVFQDRVQGLRSDIWSFGMTVYELLTYKVPFHGHKLVSSRVWERYLIDQEGRPTRPLENDIVERGLDDELWNFLLQECWKTDPKERSDINRVVEFFEYLVRRRKGGGGRADDTSISEFEDN
ncbi:kinase-like protein [Neolentinus lepideus HHB14362 ss-1]|uniref:Kinase-like protein n=1 Tax=Neolentinus lepideus HHB14362 ss-1 TaxID=1314782 RepID=A0A165TSU0_9AGAM|nr:kinase-like protein [Neolentinus lepideus HHB14362 ss-1]